jgi:autonomous glycyl radical cofactor GrcA
MNPKRVIESTTTQMAVAVVPDILRSGGQHIGLQVTLHPTFEDPVKRFTVVLSPAEARQLAAQLVNAGGGEQ